MLLQRILIYLIVFASAIRISFVGLEWADDLISAISPFLPVFLMPIPVGPILIIGIVFLADAFLLLRALVIPVYGDHLVKPGQDFGWSLVLLFSLSFMYGAYASPFDIYGPLSLDWFENPLVWTMLLAAGFSLALFVRTLRELVTIERIYEGT